MTLRCRPDEVGAWLFKPKSRPKGSIVEEVKLDEESGLYPTDYDSVSEALYNESVRISSIAWKAVTLHERNRCSDC